MYHSKISFQMLVSSNHSDPHFSCCWLVCDCEFSVWLGGAPANPVLREACPSL